MLLCLFAAVLIAHTDQVQENPTFRMIIIGEVFGAAPPPLSTHTHRHTHNLPIVSPEMRT